MISKFDVLDNFDKISMQRGKTKADHQHLLVKDLLSKVRAKGIDFRSRLREKDIDYYSLTQEKRKEIINQIVQETKDSEEGNELFQEIQQQLNSQGVLVSNSLGRKQLYLIDCFREATVFPLAQNREKQALNLQCLHGITIKKELRRVIWSRIFNSDRLRMCFSKWDREVTPYKLQEELSVSFQKISGNYEVRLKDNQMQNALRIVQYFIKSQGRLPQRYHFNIALMVVDLYSFTKIEKVTEVGAVSLGIVQLLEYYNEPIEIRLNNLKKVLQIIDGDSYNFIEKNYLSSLSGDKDTRQLLQGFELFRLTAGSYFLPLETSQYIVDQLLIRKKCKLDMYSLFSIMILIISDELEPAYSKGLSLKEILERTKSTVKKDEFVEAYSVIFENIPAWFNSDDLANHPNNRLLAEMLAHEREERAAEEDPYEDEEFVVEDLNVPVRLGVKM